MCVSHIKKLKSYYRLLVKCCRPELPSLEAQGGSAGSAGGAGSVARQVFRDAGSTLRAQAVAGAGGGGDRFASATADVEGEPITSAGPAPLAARAS